MRVSFRELLFEDACCFRSDGAAHLPSAVELSRCSPKKRRTRVGTASESGDAGLLCSKLLSFDHDAQQDAERGGASLSRRSIQDAFWWCRSVCFLPRPFVGSVNMTKNKTKTEWESGVPSATVHRPARHRTDKRRDPMR